MRGSEYDHLDLTALTRSLSCWLEGGSERPHIGPELCTYIRIHRLSALLYHIGASLGEHVEQRAQAKWTLNTQAYLARIVSLKHSWSDISCVPLLIKGADYNENVYQDPGARSAVDLDILVSEAEFTAVQTKIKSDRIRTQDCATSVGYENQGVLLELHSTIGPDAFVSALGDEILAQGQQTEFDGLAVLFPSPDHRLIIWLANQSKAAFIDGLWSLMDLALILKPLVVGRSPLEWTRLVEMAKRCGLQRAFDLALLKLDHSGIWPFGLPLGHTAECRLAARLCLKTHSPCRVPSLLQRQALKLWLCRSDRRIGYLKYQASNLRKPNAN
jgi:hypothetical protein